MVDQETLQENGFFYFDICTFSEIEKLKALFAETQHENEMDGMFVSHNSGDSNTALKVSEAIRKVLNPYLQKNFPDYNYFLGHFAVKSKQTLHNFDLHRDWNLVDESVHNSIQIWIPLSISYPENGGMCFIPRSHLFNNAPRSGSLGIPLIKIEPDIYPYLSTAKLNPGQAVCFYNNTFHGSFSNPTEEDRVAVLVNIIPKNTETEYLYWDEATKKLQVYSMTANELLESLPDLEKGQKPITVLKRERDVTVPIQKQTYIPKEDLFAWLGSINTGNNNSTGIYPKLTEILKFFRHLFLT